MRIFFRVTELVQVLIVVLVSQLLLLWFSCSAEAGTQGLCMLGNLTTTKLHPQTWFHNFCCNLRCNIVNCKPRKYEFWLEVNYTYVKNHQTSEILSWKFHGCWKKAQDSKVMDKGCYFSKHSTQHELRFAMFRLGLKSHADDAEIGPGRKSATSEFASQMRNLQLKGSSILQGSS